MFNNKQTMANIYTNSTNSHNKRESERGERGNSEREREREREREIPHGVALWSYDII